MDDCRVPAFERRRTIFGQTRRINLAEAFSFHRILPNGNLEFLFYFLQCSSRKYKKKKTKLRNFFVSSKHPGPYRSSNISYSLLPYSLITLYLYSHPLEVHLCTEIFPYYLLTRRSPSSSKLSLHPAFPSSSNAFFLLHQKNKHTQLFFHCSTIFFSSTPNTSLVNFTRQFSSKIQFTARWIFYFFLFFLFFFRLIHRLVYRLSIFVVILDTWLLASYLFEHQISLNNSWETRNHQCCSLPRCSLEPNSTLRLGAT